MAASIGLDLNIRVSATQSSIETHQNPGIKHTDFFSYFSFQLLAALSQTVGFD